MKKTLIAAALVAASASASAAEFKFTGNTWLWVTDVTEKTYEQDGISLTVTSNGRLGAYVWDGIGSTPSRGNVPALQPGESLTFNFDKKVDIGTLYLRQWENTDSAILAVNGRNIEISGDTNNYGAGDPSAEDFAVNLTNVSSMTLTGTGNPAGSYFFVAGLKDVTPAAVPVPAAAWLLATGLAGLGAIKRRKKAA